MKQRILVVLLGALVLGCGGASPAPATEEAASSLGAPEQPLVPPGDARVGDRTTCLVTGEEFLVGEGSPHVEHEGRTYFFCCDPCIEQFQADPERYLATSRATALSDGASRPAAR
ncbi:MAG: YHS domain-containing protein [Sandaracinaceae bacterium]|nr:YHS domain-containing protein [Sandaracinaceae bacterium]